MHESRVVSGTRVDGFESLVLLDNKTHHRNRVERRRNVVAAPPKLVIILIDRRSLSKRLSQYGQRARLASALSMQGTAEGGASANGTRCVDSDSIRFDTISTIYVLSTLVLADNDDPLIVTCARGRERLFIFSVYDELMFNAM